MYGSDESPETRWRDQTDASVIGILPSFSGSSTWLPPRSAWSGLIGSSLAS